ncbi:protein MMS22-like [Megalops cyprinoides]|uniref:protein MMS22-like n=1 Tax=Megalops cyprinoides TaxID=118141 RepID=UPI001863C5E6|nr:protein MMS22-like [Megalops cyprinoides]
MEDDFSQSLTPPVSPFEAECQYDPSPARPPCFSCVFEPGRDESKTFSSDGYIVRGALKRLMLRLDPAPGDCETDTVEIFGFPWVTETALVESTKLLFSLFKQKILRLETLVQNSSHDFAQVSSLHYEAEDLRRQCVHFLQYVKVFTFRYMEPPRGVPLEEADTHPYEDLEAQLPSVLLEELFGVSLLIGRVRDLPANVQSSFTIHHQGKLFPPAWHLLHLHLDCHWSLLEILHLLGEKMQGQVVYAHQFVNLTGENLTSASLFEEHLSGLLCDLIGLAINKYSKVRPTEALTTHHYHCTCTKELWVLIRHLLEHRNRVLHAQSFWSYVNTLLRSLLKGEPAAELQVTLPSHCRDTLGFTWWLVTHLAELSQYGRNGTLQMEKVEDNWSFVLELLKLTCNPQGSVQEEQVRMHVHCCLSLCLLWDSNVSAVTTLWEYYCKNLNGSFTVPWLGVTGLGTVSRTPLALLEKARACCSLEPRSPSVLRSSSHAQLYRSASSFQIFLRILALHLSQDSTDNAPWRQIKGRVYSKFHQRRMKELSEGGLSNFLLLFLVLARAGELEDVAARACELLALLPPPPLPAALRALVWRGRLALLLLFLERGLDVAAPAERLAADFAQAAREFYLKTTEPSRKLALWGLLDSYLEGVQEVFETSAFLHLSEEKLLNEGFRLLLPACRQSELSSALGFLQTILAQLQRVHQRCAQPCHSAAPCPPPSVAKERHLAVAGALWANFFPFLRDLRQSQTPPPQLADAAAGFTLLALEMPGSAPQEPHTVLSIMQCFGWDDMLHPLLVTRYLVHLLQNSALVSSVSAAGSGSGSGSAQGLCVQAWVRCVLQQHVHKNADGSDSKTAKALSDLLAELTRLVFQLPEVESILQGAGLQPGARGQEPAPALATFIKAVGRTYTRLEGLAERSAMVSRALEYVGDVVKHIKPYLVNKGPQEGLQLAYWAIGYLLKQWSPLLATSKAQQLLFRIVDKLLLPHALFQQDKGLPPQILSAVKESLPLYLQGLSAAAGVSQTQGVYLKQQLHSVISHYLGRFLPATPSTAAVANHPILLAACEATPSPQGLALRRAILQVLSESFLQFKGHAPPPRLASVLSFLMELLRRTRESNPELLTLPLPQLLRCLMLVNEPQVKKLSTDTLQLVVERCAAATDGPCDQVSAALKCFVEQNAGVYDQQVYGVLETVAILDPPVASTLIPILSLNLRNTESKRGLGRNATLRNAYRKLLSHLGEAGQAELISLEQD